MSWDGSMVELVAVGRVALAAVVGAVVGLEREHAGKPAGLRTHMLVSGAAALFVVLSQLMIDHFLETEAASLVRSDPIRTLEAIITGISFLGAGTIVVGRTGGTVEGLTTAASILLAAGLGIAIALSHYLLGVSLALLTLAVLRGLGWVERRVRPEKGRKQ